MCKSSSGDDSGKVHFQFLFLISKLLSTFIKTNNKFSKQQSKQKKKKKEYSLLPLWLYDHVLGEWGKLRQQSRIFQWRIKKIIFKCNHNYQDTLVKEK